MKNTEKMSLICLNMFPLRNYGRQYKSFLVSNKLKYLKNAIHLYFLSYYMYVLIWFKQFFLNYKTLNTAANNK